MTGTHTTVAEPRPPAKGRTGLDPRTPRETLMPLDESGRVIDVAAGFTRMFMSQGEVADRIDVSRNHIGRLLRSGLFPTPDVWIARYLNGWDEQRIIEFTQAAGIIDEHGNRIINPETGKPVNPTDGAPGRVNKLRDLVSEHYNQTPRLYLGTTLIAALYQQDPAAVYTTRGRAKFIPADVVVSTRFGWAEERAIEFGYQAAKYKTTNRVDEWVLERTTHYQLPAATWAVDRAIELGPDMVRLLVGALKTAEHPVPRKLTKAAQE
jgi:hypothetical protein